eukprot:GEMP01004627.1.p1 GENE.GEMP01004627.1~~GEMP01004627.1.p1  ORF type:complete len:650 (+),score=117.54 GEMP01004627.1:161-2110(+)
MGGSFSGSRDEFNCILDYLPPGDAAAVLSVRARVHTDRDVASDYIVQPNKVLGHGLNGDVKVCTSRKGGRQFALKVFSKGPKTMANFRNEVLIFLEMDHPNVARLYDVYETKYQLSLVMEYCRGGELYDQLIKSKRFTEVCAQQVTRQMMHAVSYLHHKNIVHRDLKLENFLYTDDSKNARLKLIDFGFSYRWANHSVKMKQGCGSLMYVAPEVIKKSYTNKCDLWSLGVIVYVLISGTPPFWHNTHKGTLREISEANYSLSGGNWDLVSSDAKHFVSALLTKNPAKRPNAEQALQLPWMIENQTTQLGVEVLRGLREFAEAQKFRRAALTILAWTVRAPERAKVEHLFLALDRGKAGYVCVSEFQSALRQEFDIDEGEAATLFNRVTDGTKMHYTDFLAAMVNHRIDMTQEIVMDAFSRFDVDHTGFISADDLQHVLGETFEHECVTDMITSVTQDPRGISYDEFSNVLRHNERRCIGKVNSSSSFCVSSSPEDESPNVTSFATPSTCTSQTSTPRFSLERNQHQTMPMIGTSYTVHKSPRNLSPLCVAKPYACTRHRIDRSPLRATAARPSADISESVSRSPSPHVYHDTPHHGRSDELLCESGRTSEVKHIVAKACAGLYRHNNGHAGTDVCDIHTRSPPTVNEVF